MHDMTIPRSSTNWIVMYANAKREENESIVRWNAERETERTRGTVVWERGYYGFMVVSHEAKR
jgi:hypothetical protein